MRRHRLDLVLVVYLAIVAAGVFGPNPGHLLNRAGEKVKHVEVEIRSTVSGRDAAPGPAVAQNRNIVGSLNAEEVGNILVFVPVGLLFPLRWPRWRWWAIPVGVALSASIELGQLWFLSWRSASLRDIKWNSVGTVIGFSLWLLSRAVHRRRTRAS